MWGVSMIRSRARLRQWVVVVVVAAGYAKLASADKMGCPPGENCEISIGEKIRRSTRDADFVALGSFELTPQGVNPKTARDGIVFTEMVFRVVEVLKGQVSTKAIPFNLNVYTAPEAVSSQRACKPCAGEPDKGNDAIVLSQELGRLERALESGQLSAKDYQTKLAEARRRILTSSTYRYNRLVLVPIYRGRHDVTYRTATVPVEIGKQYVFMSITRPEVAGVTRLFSHQLDLYPTAQLSAVRASLSQSAETGRPQ